MRNHLLEGTGRRIWLPWGLWGRLKRSKALRLVLIWPSGFPHASATSSVTWHTAVTLVTTLVLNSTWPSPWREWPSRVPLAGSSLSLPLRLLFATLCHLPVSFSEKSSRATVPKWISLPPAGLPLYFLLRNTLFYSFITTLTVST